MTQLQPDLRNADYQGQNLRFRSFMMADLRGANFGDCDLTGADFRWADLRDACFDGAVLDHADLSGAVLDKPIDLSEYSVTPAKKWRVKVEVVTTTEEWVDVTARDRKEAEKKPFVKATKNMAAMKSTCFMQRKKLNHERNNSIRIAQHTMPHPAIPT